MKFFNWGGSKKIQPSVVKSGDFQQLQTSGIEQQRCKPKVEYNYNLFGHEEQQEKDYENLFAIGTIGDALINDTVMIADEVSEPDDDYYSYYICGLGAAITRPNECVRNSEPVAEHLAILPASAVAANQSPSEPGKKQSLLCRFGKALRSDMTPCPKSDGQVNPPKKSAKPVKHASLPVSTAVKHHQKSKLAKLVEAFRKGKKTKVCPDPASYLLQALNNDPNPEINYNYDNGEAMSSSSFPTLARNNNNNNNNNDDDDDDDNNGSYILQHPGPQQEEEERGKLEYYSDEEEEEEGNTDSYCVYGTHNHLDYSLNRHYWIHSDDEFVVLEM